MVQTISYTLTVHSGLLREVTMSFEALMGQAAQLGMAVEAAAAAGTHLRSTLDCAVVH